MSESDPILTTLVDRVTHWLIARGIVDGQVPPPQAITARIEFEATRLGIAVRGQPDDAMALDLAREAGILADQMLNSGVRDLAIEWARSELGKSDPTPSNPLTSTAADPAPQSPSSVPEEPRTAPHEPTGVAMAADLTNRTAAGKVVAVDVLRVPGKKIQVPEEITIKDAINVLQRTMEYEEQVVEVREEIDCFPLDGCLAMRRAVEETFGVALSEATTEEGFFGPFKQSAKELSIATGPDTVETAPWGQYPLLVKDRPKNASDDPYGADWIQPQVKMTDTRPPRPTIGFIIYGKVRRKYQKLVSQIAARTREIVREDSIYRGKAVRIRFMDDDGEIIPLPTPKFIDVRKADSSKIVFSHNIEEILTTNVLGPIVARDACRQAGIPFKRGVVLGGPFGTGKTLFAETIAKAATDNRITFLYLEDVREFPMGWRFAQLYSPCVIFGEDIDRAFDGDERTVEVDRILNTIDGVDSKKAEIMTVLTTNNIEQINRAMLRPGRIDVVVDVQPPDAEAAGRLVKVYLGNMLDPEADLAAVGEALAGSIPAIIREACERSKLSTIARTRRKPMTGDISAKDILVAAETMRQQAELLAEPEPDSRSDIEKAADRLGGHIRQAGTEAREHFAGTPNGKVIPTDAPAIPAAVAQLTSGAEHGHGGKKAAAGKLAD